MVLLSKIKKFLGIRKDTSWYDEYQKNIVEDVLINVGLADELEEFLEKHGDEVLLDYELSISAASFMDRQIITMNMFHVLLDIGHEPTGGRDRYTETHEMFSVINKQYGDILPKEKVREMSLKYAMNLVALPPIPYVKNFMAECRYHENRQRERLENDELRKRSGSTEK